MSDKGLMIYLKFKKTRFLDIKILILFCNQQNPTSEFAAFCGAEYSHDEGGAVTTPPGVVVVVVVVHQHTTMAASPAAAKVVVQILD